MEPLPLSFEELLNEIEKVVQDDPLAKAQFVRLRAYGYRTALMKAYDEVQKLAVQPEHNKLSKALAGANLMVELALMLDRWVLLGTAKDIEFLDYDVKTAEGYQEYLRNNVKDKEERLHKEYPLLAHTVERAKVNFLTNLKTTCQRVVKDWEALEEVFGAKLQQLVKIRSTGSDFHKGGTQVMLLTFQIMDTAERTIVYKPADLEVDYRIAGKTSAALAQRTGIQGESLFEILNSAMKNNPTLELEPLETYIIFPAVRGSQQDGMPKALKEAYGYLEFIPYSGEVASLGDRHGFYLALGEVVAVASALSMHDVHQENMIVRNRRPVLIDMENTLAGRNPGVFKTCATMLVYDLSSLAGILHFYQTGDKKTRGYKLKKEERRTKNRLFSPGELDDPRLFEATILLGYSGMLELLAVNEGATAKWLEQLKPVTTRVVPNPTKRFQELFRGFYGDVVFHEMIEKVRGQWAGEADKAYGENLKNWLRESKGDVWLQPAFLVKEDKHMLEDFVRLDIPSFYCRPGVDELYNSRGDEVRFRKEPPSVRDRYFPFSPRMPVTEQLKPAWLRERKEKAQDDIAGLRPGARTAVEDAKKWIEVPGILHDEFPA